MTTPTETLQSGTRRYLGWASVAYLAAITLGLTLRIHMVAPIPGVLFDHYLHAHSHTLYFGWAGVAVLALAFRAVGVPTTTALRYLTGLSIGAGVMFFAFLAGGYSPASIAISTVVMFGWYGAAWWWWRRARGASGVGIAYLRTAFAYMVLSTFGIWTLAYLQAGERGTLLSESLAIHAFLLGFAWFFIYAVIGLLITWSVPLGLSLRERPLRRALRWSAPLAWATFPLGVVGGAEAGWGGVLARFASLLLVYPAWIWVVELWQGAQGRFRHPVRMLVAWFASVALMGVGAAAGLSSAAVAARHPVVLYLHVLLLGFVTGGLSLVGGVAIGRWAPVAWWHHHLGLVIMSIGLSAASVAVMEPAWMSLLIPGLWVAMVGATITYAASIWWAWPWMKGIKRSPADTEAISDRPA